MDKQTSAVPGSVSSSRVIEEVRSAPIADTGTLSGERTFASAERKRRQQLMEDEREEQRAKDAWRAIKSRIIREIAEALKKSAPDAKGPIGTFVFEILTHSVGVDIDEVSRLVPRGTTAEDLLKHLVMVQLHTDVMEDYNVEGLPRRLRELGLKVDVGGIMDEALKSAKVAEHKGKFATMKQPKLRDSENMGAKSGKTRSAGTPKRGGRPLPPPAPTSRSKGKPKAKTTPKAKAAAKKKSGRR